MYYEYAVDPESFDSWQTTRYLLDAFGFDKGRLICDLPRKKWKRLIFERLTAQVSGEIERKRIEERLHRIPPGTLVRRPDAVYSADKDWLDNALVEHTRRAFRAVLSPKTATGVTEVLDPREVDDLDSRWSVPPGMTLQRDAATVVSELSLLLKHARSIDLVDPHFQAQKAMKVKFLYAVARNSAPDAVITMHLKEDAKGEPGRSLCATATARLPEQIPEGRVVEILVWRERTGGERFHNRFVLTNAGGVQFGDGLEHGGDVEVDRVSRLGGQEHGEYRQRYNANSTSFEFVCGTTVRGTRRD
jgi:hypothetical protein